MKTTTNYLVLCIHVVTILSCSLSVADTMTLKEYRHARDVAANKKRVIFNNDGNDAIQSFPSHWKVTPENMLKIRTTPLIGSDVTTISYATITSSFGQFTHNTSVGELILGNTPYALKHMKKSIVQELINQGTDPLKVVVDFSKNNNFEVFWSMRMNDTHDVVHRPNKPYYRWSKLKQNHPEYMFGSPGERLPFGRWSAVDYSIPAIRELAFQYFKEVCENYDIDGIELDFFRHMYLFPNVSKGKKATTEELKMITDLIRRIRTMTEEVGMRKKHPILIAIRVPDSIEYCKGVGINLPVWCKENLIDIVIGSGYFRLNPWNNLTKLKKQSNVQVIAGLSEPRVRNESRQFNRIKTEVYRARAMDAWQAGVDGLYIFNEYSPEKRFLREIRSPEKLKVLNKLYFVSYLDENPDLYLKGGRKLVGKDRLSPNTPHTLSIGKKDIVHINIGDDLSSINPEKKAITIGHARIPLLSDSKDIDITVNENLISEKIYIYPWLHFIINPTNLIPGENQFAFTLKPNKADKQNKEWTVQYRCTKKLSYPSQLPWRRLCRSSSYKEIITDNSLFLADFGKGENDMFNLIYPWAIDPDDLTTIETSLKVVNSDSPQAVCLRLANGRSVEYITFSTNQVSFRFADLHHKIDTTKIHNYRIELLNNDIKLFIDEKLAINGEGKYIHNALASDAYINFSQSQDSWNKQSLMLGSASGPGTGAAYWKYIRYRSITKIMDDFAVSVNFMDKSDDVNVWDLATGNIKDKELMKKSISSRYPNIGKKELNLKNSYTPESGILPDNSATKPKWENTRYNKNTAKIINDKDIDRKILFMNNKGSGKDEYACFTLNTEKASRNKKYLIIDLKLKLTQKRNKPQFSLSIIKKMPTGKCTNSSFRFANNWIYTYSNENGKYHTIKLGSEWHNYRIIINFDESIAEIYLDGAEKPTIIEPCYIRPNGRSMIKFGDGSSAIKGISQLASIKWQYFEDL